MPYGFLMDQQNVSVLSYMHIVYMDIYLYVLCYMCNYDCMHILGSMECENKLQLQLQ